MISAQLAFEKVAAEATAEHADPRDRLPGIVVSAVSTTGDSYVFKSGFTSIRNEGTEQQTIDENTVLWIASVTKLMTSVAAMQCVERGLVTLDQDLTSLLPELKKGAILSGFDENDHPVLSPLKKYPTLRQLLSHSAGMGYDIKNPLLMKYHNGKPKAFCGQFSAAFSKTPFIYEPGEGWQYSGSLDWVGQVVERVNGGMSLGDFMETNIWTVLGMQSTTFRLDRRPDLKARCARLTTRDPATNSLIGRANDIMAQPAEDDSGGAGVFSTITDVTKLLGALVNGGQGILSPSTVSEMFTSQLNDPNYLRNNLADPAFTMGMTTNVTDNAPTTFGIGGMIVESALETGRQSGSMQWGGLPNIAWWIDPKAGICGIYGSQVLPPFDLPSIRMKWLFERAAYEKLAKTHD